LCRETDACQLMKKEFVFFNSLMQMAGLVFSLYVYELSVYTCKHFIKLSFAHDVTYLIKVVEISELHARNESIETNEFAFQCCKQF